MRLKVILMISVNIFILTLLNNCKGKQQKQAAADIVPVKIAAVKRQELGIPIFSSGKLFPKTMVKLSFKTGGLIEKMAVDEGDTVADKQLLAVLDLSEIAARCSQAEVAFLKAQRDLERVQNLYEDRAATLEQLQNTQSVFAAAESNLEIARFNLELSRIKAPSGGKILKRLCEAGEMVGPGTPVFLFGSTENRWVIKAGVSERDIVRVSLMDEARVRFDAYPEKEFTAAVSEISQAMDPASGTYEIEIALDDKGLKLAAGFVAEVRIEPSRKSAFFVIPIDAIVEGAGSEGAVFTVKDNKAVKVRIVVAHLFPETVAVRSGLENTGFVVTSGAAYLTEGTAVRVVD